MSRTLSFKNLSDQRMNKMFYVTIRSSLSYSCADVVSVGAQLICFKLHFTRKL